MRRRLHTVLVYFGLSEDPELDARLREREGLGAWGLVAVTVFLMLAVAALWALAKLLGVDTGLTELAIAEGMLVLLLVIAQVYGDEETQEEHARRSPWREWGEHLGAVVALWSCVLLFAALLGHRPTDHVLVVIAIWCAAITLIDAVRFAWRALRRRATGDRA